MGIDFKKIFQELFPPAPAQTPAPIIPLPVKATPVPPVVPTPRPPSLPGPLIGIDVSADQGDIDWHKVASAGIKFAFIKATEGITYVDPKFHQNWNNARAAGILCSAYHFLRPEDDPHLSSKAFLDTIGVLKDSDLPPTLDFEVLDKASVAAATLNAKAWLDLVELSTKKTPIVYSYMAFFEQLKLGSEFKKYLLYMAELDVATPKVVSPWDKVTFWQYSWTGTVLGIGPKVDMDHFYGSSADLIALCKS